MAFLVIGIPILSFVAFPAQAQSIYWQDSLSQARIYFHIEESDYKEHPHRTSKAYDIIELDKKHHPTVIALFKKAYRKYPAQLLKDNIDKVYVYKQFDTGRATMGTYIGRHGFFYAIPFLEDGSIDSLDFERLIHHELSHRLHMFNYKPFDYKGWKNCNSLKYGAIKSYDRKFNPELYEKGFLHKYAVLNKWEDFASFAENIFINQPEFWDALAEHRVLREKFNITCAFYEALNPQFKRAYFLDLNGVALPD